MHQRAIARHLRFFFPILVKTKTVTGHRISRVWTMTGPIVISHNQLQTGHKLVMTGPSAM